MKKQKVKAPIGGYPAIEIEQAKKAFIEHWGQTNTAMNTLLRTHDAELIKMITGCINHSMQLIRRQIKTNPDAGKFLFNITQLLTRDIITLAKESPPPAWLVELAGTEYEMPWLMVNGKPAPGFEGLDAALSPGHLIVKRGKSRFDAPQTRDVAAALRSLEISRDRICKCDRKAIESCWKLMKASPEYVTEQRKIAALPPLSGKTKAQWLPLILAIIKRNPNLSTNERRNICEGLKNNGYRYTDAAVIKEYLKRCKKAFNSLCPTD